MSHRWFVFVGKVCELVVWRSLIGTRVIRDPVKSIGEGPIVVGVDGSDKSFGTLITGLEIDRRLGDASPSAASAWRSLQPSSDGR